MTTSSKLKIISNAWNNKNCCNKTSKHHHFAHKNAMKQLSSIKGM